MVHRVFPRCRRIASMPGIPSASIVAVVGSGISTS
jgi:hypothetical protein